MIARIEAMSTDGRGIARVNGAACFVAGALAGDVAEIALDASARPPCGELLRICEPSPDRIAHPCPHAAACTASPWGAFRYDAQLAHKRELVRRTLAKLLGAVDVPPVIASPQQWNYRNRITLHLWRDTGAIRCGYRQRPRDPAGVAISSCGLAAPGVSSVVLRLLRRLADLPQGTMLPLRIQLHDTRAGAGALLVFSPAAVDVVQSKWQSWLAGDVFPGGVWSGVGSPAGVMNWRIPVHGSPGASPMRTHWMGHELELHPAAFCQVNSGAADLLHAHLADSGAATPARKIWDLYGGYGALGMAASAGAPLTVFDVAPPARDGLARLCAIAGECHAQFVAGDLLRTLLDYASQMAEDDVIILDPPRGGAHPDVLRTIAAARARRVWYLSCNPARLARDLLRLRGHGFAIVDLQPYDFFPQTPLVEVFVRLQRP